MKAGRALFVLGCVLAVALASPWWLPGTEPSRPAERAGPDGERAAVLQAGGEAASDERSATEASERTSAAEPTGPTEDPVSDGLDVLVQVEWPDGRPAAGVEVRYWPPRRESQQDADQLAVDRTGDVEVALQATGLSATTDPNGRVRVHCCEASRVCARSNGHFAAKGVLERDTRLPLLLVLRPDFHVVVDVVHEDGSPRPGLEVVVTTRFFDGVDGDEDLDSVPLASTEVPGRHRLCHAQMWLVLPGPQVTQWSCVVESALALPGFAARAVTQAELLAGDPIQLVVPRCGGVELEFVDRLGAPRTVNCRLVDLEDGAVRSAFGLFGALVAVGDIRLGRQWRIEVEAPTGAGSPAQVWVPVGEMVGPTEEGEVARARFVVPRLALYLDATVVDSSNKPCSGVRASLTAMVRDGDQLERKVVDAEWSRANGVVSFEVPLAEPLVLAQPQVQVEHALLDEPWLSAILPDREADGDLGTFVVPLRMPAKPQELFRVRYLLDGKAVAAWVHKAVQLVTEDGARYADVQWSMEEGHAVCLGAVKPGQLVLSSSYSEALAEPPRVVARGARFDIVLTRAAGLLVPLRTDLPEMLVEGELVDADGKVLKGQFEQGACEWNSLPVGRYELRISIGGRRVVQQFLPPLVPGANLWPADGNSLDLRGMAKVVQIRVRDERGEPLDDWQITRVGRDTTGIEDDRVLDGSLARWCVRFPDEARDLLIGCAGFVPVRIPEPTADVEVVLADSTQVLLRGATRPAGAGALELQWSVVKQPFADPLLAEFAQFTEGAGTGTTVLGSSVWSHELFFAPDTELLLRHRQAGAEPVEQRIVVGRVSPQAVQVR